MIQIYDSTQESLQSGTVVSRYIEAEWIFIVSNAGIQRQLSNPRHTNISGIELSSPARRGSVTIVDRDAEDLELAKRRMDQPDGPTWREVKHALGL